MPSTIDVRASNKVLMRFTDTKKRNLSICKFTKALSIMLVYGNKGLALF